jgi:hypothetical protein
MESHEGDESPGLLNEVTNYPSSLRSSGNLPTKNLSGYNESINLRSPRHLTDIDQLRYDQSDWQTAKLVS